MKNYISYHLTRTIPGPKLKINNQEEGFEIIKQWSNIFTIGHYSKLELQITIPRKNYPKLDFLDDIFIRQPLTSTIDNNDVCEWTFVLATLPRLFDLLKTRRDFFDKYNHTIMVVADFIFLDMDDHLLKGQNLYNYDQHSQLFCFIEPNVLSIEPFFKFPFDSDNDTFKEFYEYVESNLPFKLSEKNLYITKEDPGSKYGSVTRKLRK